MRTRALIPLLLVLALAGCSAKQYHIATVSVVGAHATASLVQDEADASICGKPTAPPEGSCLTVEQRKKIAPYLSEAFDYIGQTAQAVKSVGPGATFGSVISANLERITRLLNLALDALPGETKARIQTLTKGGGK